ncbi:type I methionyl aminopeptidase [Acanthopleuribacter pedis]|uniref:Methionine aminopeptidase n=1 Tax=Acanthopleuribacter pedis TaxID=442870 RepID=A0A8J7QP54_9BACT|nr:type I methionyl aminopeptidase [Acanthopleuribacter pedis]MBO1321550.1 type I methionyl aminopeptidase [Acanthopleuribacter pedis]
MSIDGEQDLVKLKEIGRIVGKTLKTMLQTVEPGMTTAELDAVGRKLLEDAGARSAPESSYNFPGATCISVNHHMAHGIPSDKVIIKAGDLINIDVSAEKDGYYADTGASMAVPPVNPLFQKLCLSTRRALKSGMRAARAGRPLNHIGRAVSMEAKKAGFGIVRNLGSHGVGRSLHEEPKFIPSYYDPKDTRQLSEGMVITIEPFLTTGPPNAFQEKDGWTLSTLRGCYAAQFEHTIVITKNQPIVVTQV